jgi:hypothetical protein
MMNLKLSTKVSEKLQQIINLRKLVSPNKTMKFKKIMYFIKFCLISQEIFLYNFWLHFL